MTAHVYSNHYLPVRADWLARRCEPAIDPDLPIIDAHHHLWDRPGWRYLVEEFRGDACGGHNIVGSVFVQCQTAYYQGGAEELRPVGETEHISSIARSCADTKPQIAMGIVGHANLRIGAAVREVLEAHITAGEGRFCGIRHIVVWDADSSLMNPLSAGPAGLMSDATFRQGFAQLAPLGLSFDAWLFHPQIDELAALADVFSQTKIVLDHMGGILGTGAYAGKRDAVFAMWKRSIRELSKRDNVFVKLGGAGMRINGFGFEKNDQPPSSIQLADTWRPYIETCIEAFGVRRCMFESNFPVDKGSYAYGTVWNAFKRLTVGATDTDRAALFERTALSFYRPL